MKSILKKIVPALGVVAAGVAGYMGYLGVFKKVEIKKDNFGPCVVLAMSF